ncbi:AMP-binding protein [Serratia ureilytica]
MVLYTSGTTGRAKGGVDPRQSGAQRLGIGAAVRRFRDDPDRHLVTLPLFHTFGSTVQMNAGFASAATLVLVERFDAAQAIALMQRHGITFFAGVPTMYWALLNALDEHTDIELAQHAAYGGVRRRQPAGADPGGFFAPLRRQHSRRVRAV